MFGVLDLDFKTVASHLHLVDRICPRKSDLELVRYLDMLLDGVLKPAVKIAGDKSRGSIKHFVADSPFLQELVS